MSSEPLIGPNGELWEPIIGLEVHCQLKTRTKLFCGCRNAFGEPENTLTCPVCTGQPGALPVLNEQALALGVRAALAVEAEVAERSKFDRKNYFYCDLPKGYQISQFDEPFCKGGGIELASGKRIRLHRIHLEEDAGKAIHDRGPNTLVDLNRAGVPLIESVTEADLRSSDEAHEFLTSLKEIFQYAGVSDCDMEKGSLRCDVNVSVHGIDRPWNPKVELKNLNSFKNVKDAIEHEIERQMESYLSGDASRFPVQETRSFDPASGTTRTMRSKEDAHDYRYFPDPDLPPAVVSDELLGSARSALPELPARRRRRYTEDLGLTPYDAGVLTGSKDVSDFFEATIASGSSPKEAANWISNEVLRALGDEEIPGDNVVSLNVSPRGLAELISLVDEGTINNSAGRKVLRKMLVSGKDARALVEELGLQQVQDEGELEAWCREALVGKENVIADVKDGKTKALGALMGPIMKASKGRANPKRVQEILLRLIADEH